MTQETKQQLINRSKSLAWRLGMMVAAVVVDFALANMDLFNIPTEFTVVIGLALGELSKYLHNAGEAKRLGKSINEV